MDNCWIVFCEYYEIPLWLLRKYSELTVTCFWLLHSFYLIWALNHKKLSIHIFYLKNIKKLLLIFKFLFS